MQNLQQRIDALQAVVDHGHKVYEYGDDFEAAQSEIFRLKNPKPNFAVFRRAQIRQYTSTKQQPRASREYLSSVRKVVLGNIASRRAWYASYGIEV